MQRGLVKLALDIDFCAGVNEEPDCSLVSPLNRIVQWFLTVRVFRVGICLGLDLQLHGIVKWPKGLKKATVLALGYDAMMCWKCVLYYS
ncbi:hypothetical protein CDV36_015797 [Fusarium kuroshium]|uniref:Uncharacterized protein n=1 Tax=Fusarium kuroshium TaxID=2010991 RepID=A0A3M2R864_9HYPO|nr:hypothetical protein CDV36_015797 [Fusarium kuroshium]